LILGGTYSGQLVLWDMREKRTPVNRTSISKGHTHPVYSLVFPPNPTQKAPSFLSMSTDGKLCTWNPDMLVEPLSELDMFASSSSFSS
jgi:dynein intermediate chain